MPGSISAPFDYQARTRLIFGTGSVDRVGELARELQGTHALLVTDSGIVAAGHAERVHECLLKAGLKVSRFDRVEENPTTRHVEECTAAARNAKVDCILGLGGGSSMDTAKGCNFIYTNGGKMQDYWGIGKATRPMLPLIAVPTTAGTGSECQSFALIADEKTHAKMACGDSKAAAKVALLDPELTLSQPKRVTACTGIDAIAHAVESAVTRRRNALSLMYSLQAFKLCHDDFPRVLAEPTNVEARGRMLLGAALAGTAIENSMLGAAHSAANPLTAHFGIVHGQAVGMMLPHIIRFNSLDQASAIAYAELASAPEIACLSEGAEQAVSALIERLEKLLIQAEMPLRLRDCGVREDLIQTMAEEAARQWTAHFNPRRISATDFVEIYRAAF
ncbi:MAG: iron-containing alcohol dehydrogenase [Verrucomicrobiota bacterium]|nr:iron-containing alcohol dehydrogenase [Verrucomicrobiota bacterium]